MTGPIVVVKVGGSLLDWPELPARLNAYLEQRANDRLVLVVGGGRFADLVRDHDAVHRLGETASHALAIRVLDFTSELLGKLIPTTTVVDTMAQLDEAWSSRRIPILAPRRFLDDDDRSDDPLPHAWTTTTDAIAARLAVRLGAGELALLKSAEIPPGLTPNQAAQRGLVDPEFPRAVKGIRVITGLNLRGSGEPVLIRTTHRPI